jgi:hypothetical protein
MAVDKFQSPQKLIALVKTCTENTQCQGKIQNVLSGPIHIKYDLRQGDALARLLFNTALDRVIRNAGINTWENIFVQIGSNPGICQ